MTRSLPLIIILIVLFISNNSFAQKDLLTASDTLNNEELALLQNAENNSFIGYVKLADSFSAKKDSVNTGKWFLKISPYYFMFNGITPANLDSSLLHYFSLTAADKRQYATLFNDAYKTRSDTYLTFEKMVTEDQEVRNILNHVADSLTYETVHKKMRYTDSVHQAYLYNYVQEKGWPSLQNGSLYAELLAIHDHPHHQYYIPILKQAVFNHQAMLSGLQLMISWQRQSVSLDYILKQIDTGKKIVFTLPSLLRHELPGTGRMNAIEKAIKIHCPVKLILIHKCRNDKVFGEWVDKMLQVAHKNDTDDILTQLYTDLNKYCASVPQFWYLHNMPSDENNIYLYVLYK